MKRGKEENDDDKKKIAIRHSMKRNSNGNQNGIRIEALDDAGKCYERVLGKLHIGSLLSHSALL